MVILQIFALLTRSSLKNPQICQKKEEKLVLTCLVTSLPKPEIQDQVSGTLYISITRHRGRKNRRLLLLLRISFCHRSFFKICWLLPKDMCPHTRSHYFPLRGSLSSSWYTQSELKIPKKVRILLLAAKINFNKNLVSDIGILTT